MALIAKDTTLQNMPGGYASFRDLVKSGHQAHSMGFCGSNGDVSRFAARFRVAKSFKGITLAGYSSETTRGYDALFRVFLVWSAFERFMALLGAKQDTIMPRLRPYAPERNLRFIRKQDHAGRFLSFLLQYVGSKLKKDLTAIQTGGSNNITFVAAAARHIFAHGHLSAHANGADPDAVDAICTTLFDFHLAVMDKEFEKTIAKYKKQLPHQ